ncbi:uncharacterized protein [Paramormyrops kingsleyae]|uniref:uncharacterized protein n=1 Tax=Paramormyrops kingsleyae TaxID=1676925 RepID=UPI003B9772E7
MLRGASPLNRTSWRSEIWQKLTTSVSERLCKVSWRGASPLNRTSWSSEIWQKLTTSVSERLCKVSWRGASPLNRTSWRSEIWQKLTTSVSERLCKVSWRGASPLNRTSWSSEIWQKLTTSVSERLCKVSCRTAPVLDSPVPPRTTSPASCPLFQSSFIGRTSLASTPDYVQRPRFLRAASIPQHRLYKWEILLWSPAPDLTIRTEKPVSLLWAGLFSIISSRSLTSLNPSDPCISGSPSSFLLARDRSDLFNFPRSPM